MTSTYILTTEDRPRILQNFERNISATGHPVHFIFGSVVRFLGSMIEWPYIRLDQIQDRGRQPSCIILNGHISETFRPIQFVFDSRVGENNA